MAYVVSRPVTGWDVECPCRVVAAGAMTLVQRRVQRPAAPHYNGLSRHTGDLTIAALVNICSCSGANQARAATIQTGSRAPAPTPPSCHTLAFSQLNLLYCHTFASSKPRPSPKQASVCEVG